MSLHLLLITSPVPAAWVSFISFIPFPIDLLAGGANSLGVIILSTDQSCFHPHLTIKQRLQDLLSQWNRNGT